MARYLQAAAGVGAGFALGYCMPKIDALSPLAEPVEKALRQLPLPKPTIQLTYFDIAGVAEKIRLTCIVGGLPFSDVRVSFDQWGELKKSAKFGQLPIMEVDGHTHAQSGAMLNYVGKLTGLYPSCPKKALVVDEVLGLHEDVFNAIRPSILVMRDPKLAKKEALRRQAEMRKELTESKLPELFAHFEKMLAASGSGYFVGASPTTADIAVFAQLHWIASGTIDGIPKTCIDGFPRLKAHYVRVGHLPEIEKWYAQQNKK